MKKLLNFAIDKFELIESSNNSQLAKLKVYICREGNNLHNLPIEWETIKATSHTLVGKPILANFRQIYDDFGSHDEEEIPVGCFINQSDIGEEVDDEGRKWLTSIGFVWKKYFPDVFRVLERNNNETSVSMEIELIGGEGDNKSSITNFIFMGLTLLGKGIQPAIPNARALLNFSSLVKETEKILSQENEQENFASGYRGIDFTIPSQVKRNSQKGLSMYAESKRGGNPYHLATARHLTSNNQTEPSRIKKLYQSLKNKSKQDLSPDSDSMVSFMLLGGKECLMWCGDLMKSMADADSNKLSHFTEEKNIDTDNGREMEDNTLNKKKEFEKEEIKEEEKMAEKPADEKESDKPFAEEKEEPKDGGKPFAEEKDEKEKPFAEGDKPEDKEEKSEDKPFAETPAEEKAEPASEEEGETESEEDKEKARMSLNGYADVAAQLSMLGMETKTAEELSASMYARPNKTGEQFSILLSKVKELYAQNISLKEYKAGIEKAQFAHLVESTLAEVADTMPKAKLEECRVSSAKFTLETVTGWQNEVKALAFTFAKDGKFKKEDDGIVRYALPFTNIPKKEGSASLWG